MRIAYLTNGMSSTLHTGLELARRLALAGHEVVFLSPADVGAAVQARGHAFLHLQSDSNYLARAAEAPSLWPLLTRPAAAVRWVARRRKLRRDSVRNDEIDRQVRHLAPDRLVIDLEMHFAILATAALGIPTLLPAVFFALWRRPGLPPLHTGHLPAQQGKEMWLLTLLWWRLLLSTRSGEWRRRLGSLRRGELWPAVPYDTFEIDDLRAVARNRQVTLGSMICRRQWLRPYLYTRLPILCCSAREMDFPHAIPNNVHYVGPMIDCRSPSLPPKAAEPCPWQQWRQRRGPGAVQGQNDATAQGHRPLVYCSLGTVWSTDVAFLRRVLEVFGRRQDWDLVLGLGGRLPPERLGEVSDNVLVLSWAPQVEVLQQADCAVTHGGNTTLHECVRFQVPMVVCSTHHVDQDGNAARIAYHGLGVVADPQKMDSKELEGLIEQALRDRDLRRRLASMQEHLLAYEHSNLAVRLIEEGGRHP